MSIIFFGSSKYSVIVADALLKKFGLSAVVTNEDKPKGRKKILTPSPVAIFGSNNQIQTIKTSALDENHIFSIAKLNPDFLIVADYGQILPNKLLSTPKYAPLNVHHSLLPKYRGPSPAPTAISNGDKITGVTIIKMNEQLDAGDILAQKEYQLKADETTDSLLTRLNQLGGEIIIPVIENYIKGSAVLKKQDESKASFTKRLKKEDGFIDLKNPPKAEIIDRMIRAYYPWPTVWTKFEIRNSKFEIIKFLPEQKLQVEGGKPMILKDFLNGYPQAKEWIQKIFNG